MILFATFLLNFNFNFKKTNNSQYKQESSTSKIMNDRKEVTVKYFVPTVGPTQMLNTVGGTIIALAFSVELEFPFLMFLPRQNGSLFWQ